MTLEKRVREEKRNAKRRAKEERRRDKRNAPRSGPEIVSASDIVGDLPSTDDVMYELEHGKRESRGAAPIPTKLFVGSLSDGTTNSTLRAHFATYGPIVEAVVILDRATRMSRNFGFVTMADRKDAATAVTALHHSELDGNRIVVSVATER